MRRNNSQYRILTYKILRQRSIIFKISQKNQWKQFRIIINGHFFKTHKFWFVCFKKRSISFNARKIQIFWFKKSFSLRSKNAQISNNRFRLPKIWKKNYIWNQKIAYLFMFGIDVLNGSFQFRFNTVFSKFKTFHCYAIRKNDKNLHFLYTNKFRKK